MKLNKSLTTKSKILLFCSCTPSLLTSSAGALCSCHDKVRWCSYQRAQVIHIKLLTYPLRPKKMDISPGRSFYISVSNFSTHELRLLWNMKITHTPNLPRITHAVQNGCFKHCSYRDPRDRRIFHRFRSEFLGQLLPPKFWCSRCLGCSRLTFSKSKIANFAPDSGLEGQFLSTTARLVRWVPTFRQMVRIYRRYYQSLQLKAIRNSHFGLLNVAKNWIELLKDTDKQIYLALYRAGPKTRGFKKLEIEMILGQKVIQLARTGWTAPIVFAPNKDGTLCFWVSYKRLNAATKQD